MASTSVSEAAVRKAEAADVYAEDRGFAVQGKTDSTTSSEIIAAGDEQEIGFLRQLGLFNSRLF